MQIGIVGSMADLEYSSSAVRFARRLGSEVAASGDILVFGAEKDSNSLPTEAALAARRNGGITLGITYESGKDIYLPDSASVIISTGMVRGGGREMVQALSCDAIIAIAGGSGTLNEITVAYQANIPVVVIDVFSGWSKKLANTYLDERKRYRFMTASDPKQAVEMAKAMYNGAQDGIINTTV